MQHLRLGAAAYVAPEHDRCQHRLAKILRRRAAGSAPAHRCASGAASHAQRRRGAARRSQARTLRGAETSRAPKKHFSQSLVPQEREPPRRSRRASSTVIRASAGLAEVSVARDDWAAAEDAVKLALAASEVLAPEIANRELALVAKPLAVAAVGSGHTACAGSFNLGRGRAARAGPAPRSRARRRWRRRRAPSRGSGGPSMRARRSRPSRPTSAEP